MKTVFALFATRMSIKNFLVFKFQILVVSENIFTPKISGFMVHRFMCLYSFLNYYFIFGLGFVAIVELRRMNARSIVGAKDVFLSYAHINIALAKKVKVGTRIHFIV